MRRFILSSTLIAALALMSACGDNAGDNKVTETQMDDLDSIEGTISDDMINTDESTDEAPVDAASPADGTKPTAKPGKEPAEKSDDPLPAKTDDKAEAE